MLISRPGTPLAEPVKPQLFVLEGRIQEPALARLSTGLHTCRNVRWFAEPEHEHRLV
jgi:hypothetical protein